MMIEYDWDSRLALEAANVPKFRALFQDWSMQDISQVKSARKTGTDFLLYGANGAIRVENKFEEKSTGNLLFELISVDRPGMVPGWAWTSQAAYLLCWYAQSEEVVIAPMAALRDFILSNPLASGMSTTAYNPRRPWRQSQDYLTWSVLFPLRDILNNVPGVMWVDLVAEGVVARRRQAPMLTAFTNNRVDRHALSSALDAGPLCSTPRTPPNLSAWIEPLWGINKRRYDKTNRAAFERLFLAEAA